MAARRFRIDLLWVPLLAAALLAIHLPGLGNRLVFDDEYLASGRLFADYASPFEMRARMLSYGSFVWVRDAFGEGWWKQRLVNLLLHAGVVASLWAMYREILKHIAPPRAEPGEPAPVAFRDSPALPVAIGFFALNPVSVYAVDYLIQRSIVMATLFVVLALWLFARGVASGRPGAFLGAAACYAAAVMSKEHAILAPLAAVPVYVVVARPGAARLAAIGAAGIAAVGLAAAALFARYGEILGTPFDEFSRVYLAQLAAIAPGAEQDAYGLSIVNQAWLFFHYGLRWFLPAAEWMSISLRPPFPVSFASFPHVLGLAGYAGILLGGFWLVLRHRDWRALAGLAALLPALLFATEFVTVWVQDPFVLYRSYLWAIGVPGLLLVALHGTPPRVLGTAALVVGGLLAWQSLDRVFSLATPQSAWTDAIRKLPDDPRAVGRWFPYLNRGAAYVDNREYNLAMADFEASSRLGDMGMGTFNRGSLFAANGEHGKALASFDHAERQGYDLFNLPFQRGLSLLAIGRPAEALPQLERARQMQPPSPTRELVLWHLGRTAMQLGKPDVAAASLAQLLAIEPGHRDARQLLAMAHVMNGEPAAALPLLDALIAGEANGRAYYARALAHFGLRRKAEALADIDQAIRIGPDTPHLREWRAKIQAME